MNDLMNFWVYLERREMRKIKKTKRDKEVDTMPKMSTPIGGGAAGTGLEFDMDTTITSGRTSYGTTITLSLACQNSLWIRHLPWKNPAILAALFGLWKFIGCDL